LSFYPTKRFKVFQKEIVLGELGGKLNTAVAASLRNPSDGL